MLNLLAWLMGGALLGLLAPTGLRFQGFRRLINILLGAAVAGLIGAVQTVAKAPDERLFEPEILLSSLLGAAAALYIAVMLRHCARS